MSNPLKLEHCPSCGNKTFSSGSFKPWKCSSCNFEFYQNTAAAAGALILNPQGELLTVRRSKEPSKGKLGLPGGFLDPGETAEKGLKREVLEEVNLHISGIQYLCSFPNGYNFKGLTYDTLDFYFLAHAENLSEIQALDEVDQYEWHNPFKLQPEELSFPSFVKALELLCKRLKDQRT